jgi:hypothetical protein
MKAAIFEHNHYGVFERSESSEEEDHAIIKKGIRPTGNPESRISEIGFLVGTVVVVGILIFIFTQFVLKGAKNKFEDDDGSDINRI